MKAKLAAILRATLSVLAPVAGAVQGELCKREVRNAAAKAGIVFVSGTSTAAIVHDLDFQTNVLIPLVGAVLTGGLDLLSRLQQGEPKPSKDAP